MANSTHVAQLSYEIENIRHNTKTSDNITEKINAKIDEIKLDKTFPSNLEYIDSYYDKVGGSSGCAFLDTNTGKTIVGFAGTNWDNGSYEGMKDVTTDLVGLGVSGIHPDSQYLKMANDFVSGLKNDGYTIDEVAGHSLGGALSTIVGINHNIPNIITYNGAPVYIQSTATFLEILKVTAENLPNFLALPYIYNGSDKAAFTRIEELYANYSGNIIRFVSDEDWLNTLCNSLRGTYYGNEFIINNSKDHDMKFFLEADELSFIKEVIEKILNPLGYLSVDMYGDGKNIISIDPLDLIPKNFFSAEGSYGEGVNTIEINPESLRILQQNLKNEMLDTDLEWIKDTVVKCQEKNTSLATNKETRESTLVENLSMVFDNAGLTSTLKSIDQSHGDLVNYKNTISTLASIDVYSITRNFDVWGSSGGRRWFLDGNEFNASNLTTWVKNVQNAGSILERELEEGVEFYYRGNQLCASRPIIINSVSSIANSITSVTNKFLDEATTSLKGMGLRLGKQDGIVDAVSEVMEVELENLEELRMKVQNLSDVAGVLSENFEILDKAIQAKIKEMQSITGFESKAVPKSYIAYLKENSILDDVKDVLEAYDIQVEESVTELTKYLSNEYAVIVGQACSRIAILYERLEPFIESVNKLQGYMGKEITSTRHVCIPDGFGNNEYKLQRDSHGTLEKYFPSDVIRAMNVAKNKLHSILEELYATSQALRYFNQELSYVQGSLKNLVEEAIYNTMELGVIIKAQMLVSLRIQKLQEELKNIIDNLKVENAGEALKSYNTMLGDTRELFGYFDTMVHDCFGENVQ